MKSVPYLLFHSQEQQAVWRIYHIDIHNRPQGTRAQEWVHHLLRHQWARKKNSRNTEYRSTKISIYLLLDFITFDNLGTKIRTIKCWTFEKWCSVWKRKQRIRKIRANRTVKRQQCRIQDFHRSSIHKNRKWALLQDRGQQLQRSPAQTSCTKPRRSEDDFYAPSHHP